MIAIAFLPAAIALTIFWAILRSPSPPAWSRPTTKAEREAVARTSRGGRVTGAATVAVFIVVPLLVVATLHLREAAWMPLVLR